MERNIKLTVSYDGTDYHGFQTQDNPRLPTIQAVLEKTLTTLTKEKVILQGAGRTDAGVHALGQVVNFRTRSTIPTHKFPLAMNSLLPKDIGVLGAEEVPWDFHARFGAVRKTYRYTIYNHPLPSVFLRRYSWHVYYPLDIDLMAAGARLLEGERDFRAFCASGSSAKTFVRRLEACRVTQPEPQVIHITATANGFLYNMMRIITGTLVEVGKGKLAPDHLLSILDLGDRTQAGPTAPPQGLCLMEVEY